MRRILLAVPFTILLCAVFFFSASARAEDEQYLTDWAELLPEGLYDFFPEDMTTALWVDPEFQQKVTAAERQIRHEVNNRPILLPGFMVPLVYEGADVTEFLLVPSAGQCIHVPPPPVNQTIFVSLEKPTRIRTYGEPLIVEGTLSTTGAVTQYAETGYRIQADTITDFNFEDWEKRLEKALSGGAAD